MKPNSLISIFNFSVILLLVLTSPNPSFSEVGAGIYPSNPADETEFFNGQGGYLSTNPNLTPVINNERYSHTTHIEVDQNTGRIKGYAGYNLDAAKAITRTENLISTIAGSEDEPALVANAFGYVLYETNVKGSGGGGTSFATVFIEVEGSFNYELGAPTLGLSGAISIGIAPGGDIFKSETFIFDGEFSNLDEQTWIPGLSIVSMEETLQVYDAFGGVLLNPTIPGVTTDVQFIGMDPGALKMRVSLTVPIQDGDVWYLEGIVVGGATHAFLENFTEIEVGETGDVDAASGYVDFLGTASLGVVLPEGFALEGKDAPPLSIISTPSSVPVAPSILFLTLPAILSTANK